ncbi:MAG: hypothetical protein Q7J12_09460 [Syntrophales bacterium]|nr:hypothetical protein [Syntrophales bacterium]
MCVSRFSRGFVKKKDLTPYHYHTPYHTEAAAKTWPRPAAQIRKSWLEEAVAKIEK